MNGKLFLGFIFLTAVVVAGCGGGGNSSAPTQGMLPKAAMGLVNVQLDARIPSGVGRKPDYISAGATTLSYSVVTVAGTASPVPVASGSFSLATPGPCAGTGGSRTCTIGIPFGNNYQLSLSLKNGTTVLGQGTSSSFNLVLNSPPPTVSIAISPNTAAGTLVIATASPAPVVFLQNGVPQSLTLTVNELDPLGNIISLAGGSVPNWPTVSFSASDGTVATPAPIASAPAAPGPTGVFTYSGGAPSSSPPWSIVLSIADTNSHTASLTVPVVSMSVATPAAASNVYTFTEYNSSSSSFDVSSTGTGSCGTAVLFNGAAVPSVSTTPFPSVTASPNVTLQLTVVAAPSALATTCPVTVAAHDYPSVQQTVTVTTGVSLGVGLTDKRRHGR